MSDNRRGVAGHTGTRNKHVGNVENYLKPDKGDLSQWGHFYLKGEAITKFDEAGVAKMLEFVLQ